MTPGIPSAEGLSAELVARMVALVRRMSMHPLDIAGPLGTIDLEDARAIAALLPEPVDPDLVEARSVAGDAMAQWDSCSQCFASGAINAVRTGNDDESLFVVAALAGIKRGRALAKRDPSHAA